MHRWYWVLGCLVDNEKIFLRSTANLDAGMPNIAYDVRWCCHKHIDETFREWMDGMTHIKLLYDWHWNRNGKAYGGGASIIWMLHNWTGTVRVCVCVLFPFMRDFLNVSPKQRTLRRPAVRSAIRRGGDCFEGSAYAKGWQCGRGACALHTCGDIGICFDCVTVLRKEGNFIWIMMIWKSWQIQ